MGQQRGLGVWLQAWLHHAWLPDSLAGLRTTRLNPEPPTQHSALMVPGGLCQGMQAYQTHNRAALRLHQLDSCTAGTPRLFCPHLYRWNVGKPRMPLA